MARPHQHNDQVVEIPIGLGSVFTVLLLLVSSISSRNRMRLCGDRFTVALYVAFGFSERANKKLMATRGERA